MAYPKINIVDRIAMYSKLNLATMCLEWTRKLDQYGYGRIVDGEKTRKAHRVSYEIHVGEIPEGMMVCHTCDNRRCINPDHLFLGTANDNVQDMMAKGRYRSGGKPHFGESNGNSKLTKDHVAFIRESGKKTAELAQMFAVSRTTIQKARNKKFWKSV